MIKWIPKKLIEMEEFLPEELKPLRDYVKKTRGEDISVLLHVYEERVLLSLESDDKHPIPWSVVSCYQHPNLNKDYKEDERKVKKYFLMGWLEVQLWDRGLHKEQKIYHVPVKSEDIGLSSDKKGQFFHGEKIRFSLDVMKQYWEKYLNLNPHKRQDKTRFFNPKLSVTRNESTWYIFVTSMLRKFYYGSDEKVKNQFTEEFPLIREEMTTISCAKKHESAHAAIANYDSWQMFLHIWHKEREKDKDMENTILGQMQKLHKDASDEQIPIPDEIQEILNRIATDTRVSELTKSEQDKINRAVKHSPKVRLELRKAQLNYIRLKKIEAYQEYLEKKEQNWLIRLMEWLKPMSEMMWDKRLTAGVSFGVVIACFLSVFLFHPVSLDSRINKLYQPVIRETMFQSEKIKLPWEGITQKSVSGVSPVFAKDTPVSKVAFAAGLWAAQQMLLQNTIAVMPDFLTPKSQGIKAEKWGDTEWELDYYMGKSFFLIWAVSSSGLKIPDNFWEKQRVIFEELYEDYLKRPVKSEKYEYIKSVLEKISQKDSLKNTESHQLIEVFEYYIKYFSP